MLCRYPISADSIFRSPSLDHAVQVPGIEQVAQTFKVCEPKNPTHEVSFRGKAREPNRANRAATNLGVHVSKSRNADHQSRSTA